MSSTPVAEVEVTLSRVFDAPLDLVWHVWTSAEHVAKWWGPHSFTNPVCEWEARPGGKILIHMQGPDGTVHPMTGEFIEVLKPLSLVFTSAVDLPDGVPLLRARTSVTFNEQDGKTQIVLIANGAGYVDFAKGMLAGMEMGWSQSLEKLGNVLGERV